VIAVGERVAGDAGVWTAPNQRRTLAEICADGRALFLFYLFDWSST
jgi:hypothetical protein